MIADLGLGVYHPSTASPFAAEAVDPAEIIPPVAVGGRYHSLCATHSSEWQSAATTHAVVVQLADIQGVKTGSEEAIQHFLPTCQQLTEDRSVHRSHFRDKESLNEP